MSAALLWLSLMASYKEQSQQPNIIIMLADDLGWNDVGWHNPDIQTPNLDYLARDGVTLDQSYVMSLCSPSRAALLTGYYPFRLGMQHGVLKRLKPHGLPLNIPILPEKLRELGYSTHAIGKWHLGFCNWEYTPTFRGFDSFFGFYSGSEDYYKHKAGPERGYDFRYNTKIYRPRKNHYSTKLFTQQAVDIILHHKKNKPFFMYLPFQSVHAPLEVPKRFEYMYSHIKNRYRRIFSGMVTAMDTGVGDILEALWRRKIYDNTIIVFLSDNGGSPYNGGNNWPLRGGKSTLWEGGTRSPSFVWGKMLNKTNYVNQQTIHAVDWFPTLLSLAGGKADSDIDGINQWGTISRDRPTKRTEFVYGINGRSGRAAIRMGDYKLIEGSPGLYKDWYPPVLDKGNRLAKMDRSKTKYRHYHTNDTRLYNIRSDPIESNDLASKYPLTVAKMRRRLETYKAKEMPPFLPRKLKRAHPKFWGKVWSPGWC